MMMLHDVGEGGVKIHHKSDDIINGPPLGLIIVYVERFKVKIQKSTVRCLLKDISFIYLKMFYF